MNIRNLLPYFLLIAIYFFFINLEAKKEKDNNIKIRNEKMSIDDKSMSDEKNLRITIPVIPYN
tara:strand:+ start:1538 stop:1726 length:189 start_codon:yes stop_codon:yes gene_type:complete